MAKRPPKATGVSRSITTLPATATAPNLASAWAMKALATEGARLVSTAGRAILKTMGASEITSATLGVASIRCWRTPHRPTRAKVARATQVVMAAPSIPSPAVKMRRDRDRR